MLDRLAEGARCGSQPEGLEYTLRDNGRRRWNFPRGSFDPRASPRTGLRAEAGGETPETRRSLERGEAGGLASSPPAARTGNPKDPSSPWERSRLTQQHLPQARECATGRAIAKALDSRSSSGPINPNQ